jgi:hypothetical protein
VGEFRVGFEGFSSRRPSIRMLGLENLTDGFPGFLVDVIGIEDSAFFPIRQISDVRYLTAPRMLPCRIF